MRHDSSSKLMFKESKVILIIFVLAVQITIMYGKQVCKLKMWAYNLVVCLMKSFWWAKDHIILTCFELLTLNSKIWNSSITWEPQIPKWKSNFRVLALGNASFSLSHTSISCKCVFTILDSFQGLGCFLAWCLWSCPILNHKPKARVGIILMVF
jgi:hypothetical protein